MGIGRAVGNDIKNGLLAVRKNWDFPPLASFSPNHSHHQALITWPDVDITHMQVTQLLAAQPTGQAEANDMLPVVQIDMSVPHSRPTGALNILSSSLRQLHIVSECAVLEEET